VRLCSSMKPLLLLLLTARAAATSATCTRDSASAMPPSPGV
jgi:hypothetical protein